MTEKYFTQMIRSYVRETKCSGGCRGKDLQMENSQEDPVSWEMLPDMDPDAVCTVLCSSGTTASPRGICLSQRNLCSCAEAGIQKLSYPTGCRYVSVLPMSHAFGLVADLLGAVYTGGTLCIPASAMHFFASLKYYKPDAVHIPPAAADKLAEMLSRKNDHAEVTGGKLKKILCAGAPLNIKTIRTLRSFGILALSAYGQTECSPCISMNRDRDHRDGSAGLVLNSLEVRIAKDREILVKGNGVMKGYLNEPELTGQTIRDGWLHTGDIGYLDQDGFLYVTGRKKNLAIFSDGTKYVPEALEECLNENEEISETLVEPSGDGWSITVFLADPAGTDALDKNDEEAGNAGIKSSDRENTVSEWIRRLAVQKTNHRAERIRFAREPLPRNCMGKLIRKR